MLNAKAQFRHLSVFCMALLLTIRPTDGQCPCVAAATCQSVTNSNQRTVPPTGALNNVYCMSSLAIVGAVATTHTCFATLSVTISRNITSTPTFAGQYYMALAAPMPLMVMGGPVFLAPGFMVEVGVAATGVGTIMMTGPDSNNTYTFVLNAAPLVLDMAGICLQIGMLSRSGVKTRAVILTGPSA